MPDPDQLPGTQDAVDSADLLNLPTPLVTTVEEHAWKHQIEPYAPVPVIHTGTGELACVFCGNTRFRRSRVRFHDLRELLLLRYPMRCMRCNQRQYGYFLTAGLALAPKIHGQRLARGKETWKAWTEAEMNGQSLQRPMSTSIGTKATKLERLPGRREQADPRQTAPKRPDGWRDEDRQIW